MVKVSPLRIKTLRLITPELANALDIPAESPVFVSPYVTAKSHCDECDVDYTPLIYGVGHRTEAQHFCNNGGIYLSGSITDQWQEGSWIAQVQIEQQAVRLLRYGSLRSGTAIITVAAVTPVRFISPRCHNAKRLGIRGEGCTNYALTEGVLDYPYKPLVSVLPGDLVPYCYTCASILSLPRWTFVYDKTNVRFRYENVTGTSAPSSRILQRPMLTT